MSLRQDRDTEGSRLSIFSPAFSIFGTSIERFVRSVFSPTNLVRRRQLAAIILSQPSSVSPLPAQRKLFKGGRIEGRHAQPPRYGTMAA